MATSTPKTGWRGMPGMPGASKMPPGPGGSPAAPSGDGGPAMGRPMVTIATYPEYPAAQQAVDYLSDHHFAVERTAIVGANLTLVENVLGRMTTGRSALAGAATGAWFGLFIGLLFGIFAVANWIGVVIAAVLIGAAWGAIFGAVAHAMTGGRRDFTSASSLRASEYAVTVEQDAAEEARQLLGRMSWQPAGAGR
ncbi:MAG TPA: general stress protein [Micromonosporaceae bacterium]